MRTLPRILRSRLEGLRVAVDVQHLFKPSRPNDRGACFELANGLRVWESQAATAYAHGIISWLQSRGAAVLSNDPTKRELVGSYAQRNRYANTWGADAYLACHVNAGGGNYALVEYAAGREGSSLARAIGAQLVNAYKDLIPTHREQPLTEVQRGYVCIGGTSIRCAAVLLEPFFGDQRTHQGFLDPVRLVEVGTTIAEAVALWWESDR